MDAKTFQRVSFISSGISTDVIHQTYSRAAQQRSTQYTLSLSLPPGDLILSAVTRSQADSGEVAVGESKYSFWVRQVPNLINNTAISHGADLSWHSVIGATDYQIYLRKNPDPQWFLMNTTQDLSYQLNDLYSSPHEIKIKALYQHRPQWIAALNTDYVDAKSEVTPLNISPMAVHDSVSVSEGSSSLINVLANDNDPDAGIKYLDPTLVEPHP